jgi:uncharacterized protein
MLEFIKQPWHWAVAGSLIGLTVPILLLIGNKKLGISSSLRHICASCFPADVSFFQYNWKKEAWNLFFVGGIFIGGFLAATFLQNPAEIQVAQATKDLLKGYGISNFNQIMPPEVFNLNTLFTLKGFLFFVVGGFLVGFGTRYAGGCTSGHTIMGLANLQLPSLIATCCFMAGGFFSAHFILPFLF